MESMMFGLTTNDVRCLAFQLAERNGLSNQFNKENEKAGKDWLYHFMKRHNELTLRQPKATSAARARAFNPVNVKKFFDLLEPLIDQYKFPANNIYNVDETGISTVQGRPSKIIAKMWRRQVGSLVSAERDQLVIAVICMNVTGSFIPPLFIFPRVRMKDELMNGSPPGSLYECHKTGWMQMDIFTTWFKHFIRSSGASKNNTVLLILDGHSTHTKNLELIDLARENGVVLLCLPPHCSHRMQPLDVSFMKPLSTYYDQELEKWPRNNPGKIVTTFQITELFGHAYVKAATSQTAATGLRKTGIFATNRDIFLPHEFAAADPTDMPVDDPEQEVNLLNGKVVDGVQQAGPPDGLQQVRSPDGPQQVAPTDGIPALNMKMRGPIASTYGYQSPLHISPPPKISRKPNTRPNSRRGATVVLTSSPYKAMLLEAKQQNCRKSKPTVNQSQGKRNKLTASIVTKMPLSQSKKSKGADHNYDSCMENDSHDAECIYCGELWSECKDDMI